MGKLHTLRRAIKRNPEKWIMTVRAKDYNWPIKSLHPLRGRNTRDAVVEFTWIPGHGANQNEQGDWEVERGWFYNKPPGKQQPYRKFVKHILINELGYVLGKRFIEWYDHTNEEHRSLRPC